MEFESLEDKFGYAIGINLAINLHRSGMNVKLDSLFNAISDIMEEKQPRLTEKEANDVINKYFTEFRKSKGDINKAESERFLNENAKQESVVTTKSGLQYKILQKGEGKKPSAIDSVVCHFHGTLINGKVFDDTYEKGKPATFKVTSVIQGWLEALQMMPVGSKWQLFVPADLAYGESGIGGTIESNMALIFEIELLDIEQR